MQYNMIYAATSNNDDGSNYWDDGLKKNGGCGTQKIIII